MLPEAIPVPSVANHGTMKNHNLASFMQTLRRHAPISRANLSRLTGIDKKCVSMFSAELMKAGFIREAGVGASSRGRPAQLLDFIPRRNYSLGLAVQARRINCALFEFPAKPVRTEVRPLPAGISVDALVDMIRRLAGRMARQVGKLAGIGISFPGLMDLRRGVIHSAANLDCLDKFRFREPFRKLGLGPVWFEHSSRAAALAENWFGLGATAGSFANLEINVGISVVMVDRSRLYHGPESFVGELGHVVVQPRGKKCRCGNRGCLEAYLGETALKEDMRAAGVDPERLFPGGHPAPLAGNDLRPPEIGILRKAGAWLGRGLGTIINLFSPDSVIMHGGLMRYAGVVLPAARKELAKSCFAVKVKNTALLSSSLEMPDAVGAAALAFPGWFDAGFDALRSIDADWI
ncbi:MAG: ROK family protein [Planctomycetota bacterium]|jgi:predicted NBD/HSP70 family sugar kinase|nr:ROK family protein [Planctomycetota bacterium]